MILRTASFETDLSTGAEVGDYVITGPLGEGGMATVYSAIHPLIDKRVALKVIRPVGGEKGHEVVERFLQEARALNLVHHANVVDIFGFGTLPDGRCYLVMEWLAGQSLHELVGELSILDTLDVVRQISDGMHAVHEAGLIHRDLKPENVVMVRVDGRQQVKVLDFGIAKFLRQPDGSGPHTRLGLTLGTPAYVAPEQARGREVFTRTDVYSLGVLAYELLTGRLPFVADNAADTMAMHLSTPPPFASRHRDHVPAQLDELLVRMMAKGIDARPTMAEVSRTLVAISRDLLASGGTQGRGAPWWKKPWRNVLSAGAALLLAAPGPTVLAPAAAPPEMRAMAAAPPPPAPSPPPPSPPPPLPMVADAVADVAVEILPPPRARSLRRARPERHDFHLVDPWKRAR